MKHYKRAYCTLNRVIQRINADSSAINVSTTVSQNTQIATESANFQAEIKDAIYAVSDLISAAMETEFVPYRHTYTLQGLEWRQSTQHDRVLNGRIIYLPDNLLQVVSLTWDGALLTSSQYRTRPIGESPISEILIDNDAITSYPDDFGDTIDLVGIWGYHSNVDNLWLDSGDAVAIDSPLSATATTVNVTSGGNFKTFQYIRIEDEYLFITSISDNALTVERGVNGTTAASHVLTTQVDTFVPTEAIADECARLALRRYWLKSGVEVVPVGETAFELKVGDVKLPNKYRRYYVRTV